MSYTYSTLMAEVATLTAIPATDENFLAHFPTAINDAEMRIYRELELLVANITVTSYVTANTRAFTLPVLDNNNNAIHFLVIDSVNIIDARGARSPVTPSTREVIDFLYPSEAAFMSPSIPKEFCRPDETRIMYGPPPDSNYAIECVGTIRPAPLSATNTTSYTSLYLSDLLLAGVMSSFCGYMRNFGAMADDPRMAVTWRDEFNTRLASARKEELSKSFTAIMSAPPASLKEV
jgi:hypothetical protein